VIKHKKSNVETFEIVDKIESSFRKDFENAYGNFSPIKQRFIFVNGIEALSKRYWKSS
jgi:hypothetical protein